MGKELELYQQEMNKAYKPILARLEHYKKGAMQIRSLLKDYFFNATRISKLMEPSNAYQVIFDFNTVKEAMEICLLDEDSLNTPRGLVTAFDQHIIKSDLPLELQEDHCLYLFKPTKPYTPEAQTAVDPIDETVLPLI